MPSDGILTTIDIEAENQRDSQGGVRVGHSPPRTGVITGRAIDVLRRMTDGAYDIVLIDADKEGYPGYRGRRIRLLRSGGVVILDNMLWHDEVADPAASTPRRCCATSASRSARTSGSSSLLPAGDGLLVAVKR